MRKEFHRIVFWMTLWNVLDILMTYFAMPDLYNEANYWVRKLDLGWPGLITVLVVWQVIFTLPSIYRCYWNIPVNYNEKITNYYQLINYYAFRSKKLVILPNKTQFVLFGKSITNFLGYYCPRYYCTSKVLVTIDNFLRGLIYRDAIHVVKKDGWTTLTLDTNSFYYKTKIGNMILWYTDLNYSQVLFFQNTILLMLFFILSVLFFRKEMQKINQHHISAPYNTSF
jgi:hypothetical protein